MCFHQYVVADTTKVRIFKQITTRFFFSRFFFCCCWYYKGTNFQANHNCFWIWNYVRKVVADTTKVRIFKQITTVKVKLNLIRSCCWYYKGTNFQANHNCVRLNARGRRVVADTTKVRIFKQITTTPNSNVSVDSLLLILQRYEFSSKSQRQHKAPHGCGGCCWYYKGTNFQANHNTAALNDPFNGLLLILQRYEFSSKSQQEYRH